MSRKIRVLIVDDSAVVRKLVTDALRADPEIEVVGTAIDPYVARDKIKELNPDVLTLDLEMPRMDGLTFLRILMEQHPMPVVIMSSLSQRGSEYALEALRLGACDVLGKPSGSYSFGNLGPQLIARIKSAAGTQLRRPAPVSLRTETNQTLRQTPYSAGTSARQVILLGASTGGTEALRQVLTQLPDGLPGMAKPPKDVDASTRRRTRRGYENAICCATAPPNEAPSTWADSMPSSSSTAVPKRASAHMVSGKVGICDRPMPGGSKAIVRKPRRWGSSCSHRPTSPQMPEKSSSGSPSPRI